MVHTDSWAWWCTAALYEEGTWSARQRRSERSVDVSRKVDRHIQQIRSKHALSFV
jgi:hypothetical protein